MSTPTLDTDLTAYLAEFVTAHKLELFEQMLDERTRHVRVVLEDVYQEYNASACLRSCEAFGIQNVHIVEADNPFRPDRETSRGTARWLTLRRHPTAGECLESLRREGLRIVATSPDPAACDLYDLDVARPFALVFGSEKPGVSSTVVDVADELVRIPMHGFVESFNVSVAVALCLQHVIRTLRSTDAEWQLSESERERIRAIWIRNAIGFRLPEYERRFTEERGRT